MGFTLITGQPFVTGTVSLKRKEQKEEKEEQEKI